MREAGGGAAVSRVPASGARRRAHSEAVPPFRRTPVGMSLVGNPS